VRKGIRIPQKRRGFGKVETKKGQEWVNSENKKGNHSSSIATSGGVVKVMRVQGPRRSWRNGGKYSRRNDKKPWGEAHKRRNVAIEVRGWTLFQRKRFGTNEKSFCRAGGAGRGRGSKNARYGSVKKCQGGGWAVERKRGGMSTCCRLNWGVSAGKKQKKKKPENRKMNSKDDERSPADQQKKET